MTQPPSGISAFDDVKKGSLKEDESGQEEGAQHFAAVQDTAHSFEVFKINSFKEPGEDISK